MSPMIGLVVRVHWRWVEKVCHLCRVQGRWETGAQGPKMSSALVRNDPTRRRLWLQHYYQDDEDG